MKSNIYFKDVSFGYRKGHTILKNISFNVSSGQTVAIVENKDHGKTSIISLLNRLYEVGSGKIKIDDVPIEDWDLIALRSSIGVVLQDVFLFSGSVLENITLRNPVIDRSKVEAAARLIDMHDFIMQLPGGYDDNVMERGATLSLG